MVEILGLRKQIEALRMSLQQAEKESDTVKAQSQASVNTLKSHILTLQVESSKFGAEIASLKGSLSEKEAQMDMLHLQVCAYVCILV